ncbi:MAG: hypothetical protein WA765_20510 [Candidatus Acidiferrum sp.]
MSFCVDAYESLVVGYAYTMSLAEKLRHIKAARKIGMTDAHILRIVLGGVYGSERRRRLVVEWGEALGLTSSEALRLAHASGLLPSAHPPRGE